MLRNLGAPTRTAPLPSDALQEAGASPRQAAAIMRMATYLARLEGAAAIEPHHLARAVTLQADEAASTEPDATGATAPGGGERIPRTIRLLAGMAGLATLLLPVTTASDLPPSAPGPPVLATPAALPSAPAPVRQPVPELLPATAPVPETPAAPAPSVAAEATHAPAARSAPPPFPLPEPARLHVVVLAPADDAGPGSLATTLTLLLRGQGYAVADPVSSPGPSPAPVPGRTPRLEVRYFFSEDGEAAASLARAIGADPAAVRLADAEPRRAMRPGTAEILAGGGSARRDH